MTNPKSNQESGEKQPRNTNWFYNLLNYIKNSFRPIDSLTKFTPLILIGVLIAALSGRKNILESLSDPAIARGLITLLFAVATVWIAMILALAAINDDKSDDNKFNRGKDILTILVGIFGTILGYYFGTESRQQPNIRQNQENLAEVQTVPKERQLPNGENQNNSQ